MVMQKIILILVSIVASAVNSVAQPFDFSVKRLSNPVEANVLMRGPAASRPSIQTFEARPGQMDLYTGTPGNWTQTSTTTYSYEPSGRFSSQETRAVGSTVPQSATYYTYNSDGRLIRRLAISGGSISDSSRFLYTTRTSDNKIISISRLSNYGDFNYRIFYNGASKIDSFNQTVSFGPTVYKYRIKLAYNNLGIWKGYITQQENLNAPGGWEDIALFDSLQLARGVTEFKADWFVSGYYDQGDEGDVYFIRGIGMSTVDSLPGLTPTKISGTEVGGAVNVVQEILPILGTWRPRDSQTNVVDAQGNVTENKSTTYYLSGQQRYVSWTTYSNSYDPQGRLTEVIRWDRINNNYLRYVYSRFGPLSTVRTGNNKITVWPNPSKGHIHVSGVAAGTHFSVETIHGLTVKAGEVSAHGLINAETLAPGAYILKIGGNQTRLLME